jgi:hypothetical protein
MVMLARVALVFAIQRTVVISGRERIIRADAPQLEPDRAFYKEKRLNYTEIRVPRL